MCIFTSIERGPPLVYFYVRRGRECVCVLLHPSREKEHSLMIVEAFFSFANFFFSKATPCTKQKTTSV